MSKLLALLLTTAFGKSFAPFGSSKRTVNGALVHFRKAIDELNAVEEQENSEAERKEQEIAEAEEALKRARHEAARARNTKTKIQKLIGEDDLAEVGGIDSLREVKFGSPAR